MTIPWRSCTSNETPKQGFYVLQPPELLPRRFDNYDDQTLYGWDIAKNWHCKKNVKKEKFCRGERAISQQGPLPLPHSGSIAFCSNTSFSVSYFISSPFQHWHRSHTCWIRLYQLLIHLLILLHHLHLTRWKTWKPWKRDVRLISAATETGPHPIGDSHYFLTH